MKMSLNHPDFKEAIQDRDLEQIEAYIVANPECLLAHDHMDFSLLDRAVTVEDVEFLKLLVKRGVDVNLQDHSGVPSLFLAIQEDSAVMVKALIEWGADVNLRNHRDQTAMDYALLRLNVDIIDELLRGGFDIDGKGSNGVGSFARAAQCNSAPLMRQLITWKPNDQSVKEALERIYDSCLSDADEVIKILKEYQYVKKEQSLLNQVVGASIQKRAGGNCEGQVSEKDQLPSRPAPRL